MELVEFVELVELVVEFVVELVVELVEFDVAFVTPFFKENKIIKIWIFKFVSMLI